MLMTFLPYLQLALPSVEPSLVHGYSMVNSSRNCNVLFLLWGHSSVSYVTLFSWKLDPHHANNVEPYTFIMFFFRKSRHPHPHLRYVTLEWPLCQCTGPMMLSVSQNHSLSYRGPNFVCKNLMSIPR